MITITGRNLGQNLVLLRGRETRPGMCSCGCLIWQESLAPLRLSWKSVWKKKNPDMRHRLACNGDFRSWTDNVRDSFWSHSALKIDCSAFYCLFITTSHPRMCVLWSDAPVGRTASSVCESLLKNSNRFYTMLKDWLRGKNYGKISGKHCGLCGSNGQNYWIFSGKRKQSATNTRKWDQAQ